MQLKSCYIENFGQISAQTFDFTAGITAILKGNGKGKTTLASFLKAMFYGLDGCRRNSKDFNDRQHFFPFGGGIFGGNLVFESAGKTYRIERVFDEKSETKDMCKVYCNGRLANDWRDPLGEQLFGLDKASFERTIFITADDIELKATDSINGKLNHVVAGGDSDTNLTVAVDNLLTHAKNYKKSNGNDRLTKAANRLHTLHEQIDNLKTMQANLPQQYTQLRTVEDQLDKLREQLQAVQSQAALVEQWRTYDEYCSDAVRTEQIGVNLMTKYPKGLCDADELADVKQTLTEYALLCTQSQATRNNHIDVSTTELQQLDAKLSEYQSLEREAERLPDYLVKGKATKTPCKIYPWLAGAMAILLLAGVGVIFVQMMVGIILTVAGGVGLLVVAFIYLNYKVSLTAQTLNPEKRALRIKHERLGDQIRSVLARYGYSVEQGVAVAVMTLKNDHERALGEDQLLANVEVRRAALQQFCERYALDQADYAVAITDFERDFNLYQHAREEATRLQTKAEQYRNTNHLVERPDSGMDDTTALNDAWVGTMAERDRQLREITEAENAVEKLDDLIQEREAVRAGQEADKVTHALLLKTVECLKTAEINLQDRYLRPIKDRFVYYAELLEKTIGEKLVMNPDFTIMYERHGFNRSSQHLSAGQKSICTLCFRLALIDNMFAKETPFLIMDDPFVHLDDVHLDKVKKLMHELGKTKQIIYFTCQNVRDLR